MRLNISPKLFSHIMGCINKDIMWIIDFLPNFVAHLIVVTGIVGVFVTSIPIVWNLIPGVSLYKFPIQLLSIFILVFGVYLEGGIANNARWEAKIVTLEKKVIEAEARSAKVDTVVVTKLLTKKQIVKEKGDSIIEYIDREVVKYDKSCPIPVEVIRAHNAAALNDPLLLSIPTEAHNKLAIPLKLPAKHE